MSGLFSKHVRIYNLKLYFVLCSNLTQSHVKELEVKSSPFGELYWVKPHISTHKYLYIHAQGKQLHLKHK